MKRPEPTRKNLLLAGGGLAAVLLLVATALSCTRTEPTLGPATPRPTTTAATTASTDDPAATTATSTTSGVENPDPNAGPSSEAAPAARLSPLPARTSEVATVKAGVDEVAIFDGPTGSSTSTIAATGDYGQQQVFLVVGREAGRLHVLLPIRPNGSRGWIDAADVDVTTHDYQIQVSISGYQMMVQKGSEVVVDTPIGVGTQDTPTVGGEFYTWVLLDPTNAGYGSYAYGLSGFSTLEQFAGGDGRMGVHGTADTSSIGRRVSHGCIRVPDDVVVRMVEEVGLPLGVPVAVSA